MNEENYRSKRFISIITHFVLYIIQALREQLKEFVENSQDENVLKARRSQGNETSIDVRIPAENKVTNQLGR